MPCSAIESRRILKKITVPVLVMHSEDDQIVPYVASGPLSAKLLKNEP
jgi:non-heme chloroperoxidase